jgi:hypothetical protein
MMRPRQIVFTSRQIKLFRHPLRVAQGLISRTCRAHRFAVHLTPAMLTEAKPVTDPPHERAFSRLQTGDTRRASNIRVGTKKLEPRNALNFPDVGKICCGRIMPKWRSSMW